MIGQGLIFIFSVITLSEASICRVLSLSGGGSHGAYQAGAISQLVDMLPPQQVQYDVVTGISTGSINAGLVTQFEKGDQKAMGAYVLEMWRSLKSDRDIFDFWTFGTLEGLFYQRAIYDTTPLRATLNRMFKHEPKRPLIVGTISMQDGLYNRFNGTNEFGLVSPVMCSGSPPFFFPYQTMGGVNYMDGGTVINLDVASGINYCLEKNGGNERDITVDVVLASPKATPDPSTDPCDSVSKVIGRAQQIEGYENTIYYYTDALREYPYINFRYLISPNQTLPGGYVPLSFNPVELEEMIQIGRANAKDVIENPKLKAGPDDWMLEHMARVKYTQ